MRPFVGAFLLVAAAGAWLFLVPRSGRSVVEAYPVDIGGQSVDGFEVGTGGGDLYGQPASAANPYGVNTRGFRNNNPGNIEYHSHNDWVGQVGSDGRYAIFSELRFGVRALSRLLQAYYYRYNLRSLESIISRWAPDDENNTAAYIRAAALRTGFAAGELLTFPSDLPRVVEAIIHHENGVQPIPFDLVADWSAL